MSNRRRSRFLHDEDFSKEEMDEDSDEDTGGVRTGYSTRVVPASESADTETRYHVDGWRPSISAKDET